MFRKILVSVLLSTGAAFAAEAQPTEASVRQLLVAAEVRQIVDGIPSQMEGMMRAAMRQVTKGEPLSAEQQAIVDRITTKVVSAMAEELTWDKLEPLYLEIYTKSFTQEEVDGLIALYKTPAGQALTKKMPVVMQNTNAAMQARVGPMMQRLQAAVREAASEIQAAKPAAQPAPATP